MPRLNIVLDPVGVMADVRGGLRRLVRTPGASLLTIVLLAVGIAGNVALFTVVNTLLIQAPPGIGDPHRAVEVMAQVPSSGAASLSYPEFVGMRDHVGGFEALAVWSIWPMAVVREGAGRRGPVGAAVDARQLFPPA